MQKLAMMNDVTSAVPSHQSFGGEQGATATATGMGHKLVTEVEQRCLYSKRLQRL